MINPRDGYAFNPYYAGYGSMLFEVVIMVPEPETWALMAFGVVGLSARRWRARSAQV